MRGPTGAFVRRFIEWIEVGWFNWFQFAETSKPHEPSDPKLIHATQSELEERSFVEVQRQREGLKSRNQYNSLVLRREMRKMQRGAQDQTLGILAES